MCNVKINWCAELKVWTVVFAYFITFSDKFLQAMKNFALNL